METCFDAKKATVSLYSPKDETMISGGGKFHINYYENDNDDGSSIIEVFDFVTRKDQLATFIVPAGQVPISVKTNSDESRKLGISDINAVSSTSSFSDLFSTSLPCMGFKAINRANKMHVFLYVRFNDFEEKLEFISFLNFQYYGGHCKLEVEDEKQLKTIEKSMVLDFAKKQKNKKGLDLTKVSIIPSITEKKTRAPGWTRVSKKKLESHMPMIKEDESVTITSEALHLSSEEYASKKMVEIEKLITENPKPLEFEVLTNDNINNINNNSEDEVNNKKKNKVSNPIFNPQYLKSSPFSREVTVLSKLGVLDESVFTFLLEYSRFVNSFSQSGLESCAKCVIHLHNTIECDCFACKVDNNYWIDLNIGGHYKTGDSSLPTSSRAHFRFQRICRSIFLLKNGIYPDTWVQEIRSLQRREGCKRYVIEFPKSQQPDICTLAFYNSLLKMSLFHTSDPKQDYLELRRRELYVATFNNNKEDFAADALSIPLFLEWDQLHPLLKGMFGAFSKRVRTLYPNRNPFSCPFIRTLSINYTPTMPSPSPSPLLPVIHEIDDELEMITRDVDQITSILNNNTSNNNIKNKKKRKVTFSDDNDNKKSKVNTVESGQDNSRITVSSETKIKLKRLITFNQSEEMIKRGGIEYHNPNSPFNVNSKILIENEYRGLISDWYTKLAVILNPIPASTSSGNEKDILYTRGFQEKLSKELHVNINDLVALESHIPSMINRRISCLVSGMTFLYISLFDPTLISKK